MVQAEQDAKLVKICSSVESNPGVFVPLLGSGVSRSAGIPTGAEITELLIEKIATIEDEEPDDLWKWYDERFDQKPKYPTLLDQLTETQHERRNLIDEFIEPTPEQREQGEKMPTRAHKSIASLVSDEYISVIMTTNFDRLIEQALEEQGITPQVLSTEEEIEGRRPTRHVDCTVIKLHGDYKKANILNIPQELEEYSDAKNNLLDRILDDHGLIICGWSGAEDVALKNAIIRSPNRRYATYWMKRGGLSDSAEEIINHRQGVVVSIEGADNFFGSLEEGIRSLESLHQKTPKSIDMAIETVKRYIPKDEQQIRLADLFKDETEKVYEEITSEDLYDREGNDQVEQAKELLKDYDSITEKLRSMLNTLAFYGKKEHAKIATRSLERLILQRVNNFGKLRRYPTTLILYGMGIASLAGENYGFISKILQQKTKDLNGNEIPIVVALQPYETFEKDKWLPVRDRALHPRSELIEERIEGSITHLIHDREDEHNKFRASFETFELLVALVLLDQDRMDDDTARIWAPLGLYAHNHFRRSHSPAIEFVENILEEGEGYELIEEGLFQGSIDRFKKCFETFSEWIEDTKYGVLSRN